MQLHLKVDETSMYSPVPLCLCFDVLDDGYNNHLLGNHTSSETEMKR